MIRSETFEYPSAQKSSHDQLRTSKALWPGLILASKDPPENPWSARLPAHLASDHCDGVRTPCQRSTLWLRQLLPDCRKRVTMPHGQHPSPRVKAVQPRTRKGKLATCVRCWPLFQYVTEFTLVFPLISTTTQTSPAQPSGSRQCSFDNVDTRLERQPPEQKGQKV